LKLFAHCLLILFAINNAFAQQSILSGRVLIDVNMQPVEYATVTVLSKDSIVLTGGLTDSLGNYKVEGVGVRDPLVIIRSIGYKPYSFRPVINVGMNSLPVVYLIPEAKQMKEVTVESAKQNNSVRLDKQVISAGQFQNAANGTGLDVLKNLGSVTINTEGQIRLRGSDGFVVLLNGKPSSRSPEDILSQLPANEIASVEIITSGSAMYDADGKAGIINIITKKNVAAGWSVNANAMFGEIDPSQYGADMTVSYNARKWSFFVSGDYRRFDYNGERIGTVRTIYKDTLTYHPSQGIRDFQTYQYSVRAGGTYSFDKNNSIDIGAYYGYKETDREADLHYTDYYKTGMNFNLFDNSWSGPQSSFFNKNLFVRQGTFFTTNLTYAHDLKNKLSILGQYEYSVLGGPVDDENLVEGTSQLLLHVKNYEHSPLNSFRGQADYSAPLSGNLKLETGIQFRYLNQKGDFEYVREDINTGLYSNDLAFSDKLNLLQTIEAAYLQVNGSKGIFSCNLGLRGEYMRRSLADQQDSTTSRYNKFDVFPTVQGLLKLGKEQKLKLSYNRRIDRPSLKLIAPFKIQEHAETVEFGDPNARSEISDNVDLTYSGNWKALTLTSTIYYNHVTDKIFRVNSIYDRTSLLRLFTNAGNTNSVGVELTANIKATKWLQFYVAGNVYEYMIQGNYYSASQNSNSVNYNLNANTTIDIIKNLKFQFDVSYLSRTVTEQGWDGHLLLANASLKYSVMKNSLSFGLKLQNIFNTNSQTITTQTPVFYSSTDYIKRDRILTFTVGYVFNQNDKARKVKVLKTDIGESDF
jgi:Outer membrane protein beta-barrel family/TonB-dependent Receptor Plug Domain